jgi:hypothetical protein
VGYKEKERRGFMSESPMERTSVMILPPLKSIPVRCKTCGKLMKIKKKNMDKEKTNLIHSECQACKTKTLKKKKAMTDSQKGLLFWKKEPQEASSSDIMVTVKCSRCKEKFEITAKQRAKSKSHLCVTCRNR